MASAAAVTASTTPAPPTAALGAWWRSTPGGRGHVGRVVAMDIDPGGRQVGGDARSRLPEPEHAERRRPPHVDVLHAEGLERGPQPVDVDPQLAGGQPGAGGVLLGHALPGPLERPRRLVTGHDHDPVVVGAHHVAGCDHGARRARPAR